MQSEQAAQSWEWIENSTMWWWGVLQRSGSWRGRGHAGRGWDCDRPEWQGSYSGARAQLAGWHPVASGGKTKDILYKRSVRSPQLIRHKITNHKLRPLVKGKSPCENIKRYKLTNQKLLKLMVHTNQITINHSDFLSMVSYNLRFFLSPMITSTKCPSTKVRKKQTNIFSWRSRLFEI